MHLEELFRTIEQDRREFIAQRAAKGCFTGSTAGVVHRGEDKSRKSANDEAEPVLTEVEVG